MRENIFWKFLRLVLVVYLLLWTGQEFPVATAKGSSRKRKDPQQDSVAEPQSVALSADGKVDLAFEEFMASAKLVFAPGLEEQVTEDPKLQALIAGVPIEYVPQHNRLIRKNRDATVTEKEYSEVAEQMARIIRLNLIYAMNPHVLRRILSQTDFAFSIQPRIPSTLHSGQAILAGAFVPAENIIVVKWNSVFDATFARVVLRNEFSTAGLFLMQCARSKAPDFSCLIPPNSVEIKRHIELGFSRIRALEKAFTSFSSKKSRSKAKTPARLRDFFTALADYEELPIEQNISKQAHDYLMSSGQLRSLENGRYLLPAGSKLSLITRGGVKMAIEQEAILLPLETEIGWTYRIWFDLSKVKKFPSELAKIKSRARAFFFHQKYTESMYAPDQYFAGKDSLQAFDHGIIVVEQISNVDLLSQQLRELFFPEYCAAMSKLYQIDNYCEGPQVR